MEMQVSDAVTQIVEAVLPRFSDERVVLHVPLDVRLRYYSPSGRETGHHMDIHLLFQRPSNYTKVFWHTRVDSFVRVHEIAPDGWEMKSDHDSCWTSDGLQSPLFRSWQDLRGMFSKKMQEKGLSKNVWFTMGGCSLYEADLKKVSTSLPFDWKYLITLGKKIEFQSVKLTDTQGVTK